MRVLAIVLALAVVSCAQQDRGDVIRTIDEFNQAAASVQPGDEIVLANGTWTDVELELKAEGLPDNPVTLRAEEPGQVIITGQSNLSFSGEHIVVSGLVFKDGYTPTREVISFRTS